MAAKNGTKRDNPVSANPKSNLDLANNLIKKLTGQEELNFLYIPLELIRYAGGTQEAVFLARLIYLSDKGVRKDGFIWKTDREWKDEIGLSGNQVKGIVDKFVKRGILEAKKMMAQSLNNNASFTWHYRLSMRAFLSDFAKFLTRTTKNLEFEQKETSGSITEYTSIIHSDITHAESQMSQNEVKTENQREDKLADYSVTSDDIDIDEIVRSCGEIQNDDLPLREPLPANFQPSLADRAWAFAYFPLKSHTFITESFIRYYSDKKHIRRTLSEWHNEWRRFARTERMSGISRDILENQEYEILNQIGDIVYENIWRSEYYLITKSSEELEINGLDEIPFSVIEDALIELGRSGNLGTYFEYYFLLNEYNSNPEFAEAVDSAMYRVSSGWGASDDDGNAVSEAGDILQYIRRNLAVTRDQIGREFDMFPSHSVDKYLQLCIKYGDLAQSGEFYHLTPKCVHSSAEHQERVRARLAELQSSTANSQFSTHSWN